MKKLLCLMLCISSYAFAQNTTSKIPNDASIVATVKGNNLLQLLSMEELNSSLIGSEMLKEVSKKDSNYTSLEDFGFNLNASSHYFFQANDSINYNGFVMPVKDVNKFDSFIKNSSGKEISNKNGVNYLDDNSKVALVWNQTTLILVVGTTNDFYFQNKEVVERYGLKSENNYGWSEALDTAEEVEIEETVIESTETYEEEVEEVEETVIESTEGYDNEEEDYSYYENINSNYEIKKVLGHEWSMKKAMSLLMQPANASIIKNKAYQNSLDANAEATLWVKDFGQLYSNLFGSMYMTQMSGFDLGSMYAGNSIVAKLYLEEDKMQLKTTYTMPQKIADSYKKMTSRKLNKKFLNYVNEDRMIGYMSYSLDTKAALEEYPQIMKDLYGNFPEFGEEASLGIDMFSLLLDEEAVSKVLNGDMLFLLSGISQQEVTYTTYEYDENYEYVEVEKTKTETLPDFLMMASSEDSSMFNKLINYASKKELITFQNGYYTFETPQSPLAIHFTIKDGIVFVGTSALEMRKITSGRFDAKVSSKHKKMMLDNTSVMYLSAKQLINQLPLEEMGLKDETKLKWFAANAEDGYIKASKMKGNSIDTEMVIDVPKSQENALKYIFDIIETFAK